MSRLATIDFAVRLRLSQDDFVVGLNGVFPAEYDTDAKVASFLMDVARNLRLDTPPLFFDHPSLTRATLAGLTLGKVVELIGEHTRERPAGKPDS